MNAEKYVGAITKRIKCAGKTKKEIKRQLLTDINAKVGQGETLENVIAGMGSVAEIAESFNENLSEKERRQYTRTKALKIVGIVVCVLAVLIAGLIWLLPKSLPIEESEYFSAEQLETAVRETVSLLDAGDYDALQNSAISQMESLLNEDAIENVKGQMSQDWGQRQQFGHMYMVELVQGGQHWAVCEVTVTYENISVTYRLTYDENMRLGGLYMR